VTRMVLSKQSDHTLETLPEAGNGRPEPGGSAPGMAGERERDSRMSSSRIDRASESSRLTHIFLRAALGAVLFVLALASVPAHAQSANSWDKTGAKAESREDFDAAFEAYRQAHLKKPKDLRYKTHYERMRFQAANQHVDRGRVLRQSGDSGGAINEFARALQIDPGNQAAAQELQNTDKPTPGAPPGQAGVVIGPGSVEQTPHQADVQREIETMGSPVTLQAVSNDPITLHMVEDVKVIYQAVGKAAGLNVLFDPDYTSKRIPVDLTSVSLNDALRIIGTLSGTFWKPVTSNTIFVAQNNRTKRTDLEDLSVQTFYLTNAAQQNDANEILITLRNILDPSIKVYLVASQNAIIMRATTDQLILAEKIINDLDRTRPEVVIDVAVLEVNRQKERNLGITLPQSFGLTPQVSNATTSSTTTNGVATTTPATTTNLTLNNLANINATNFAVNVTGGTVNALLTDSDTRILQNPRIRATDGQRATLKIGSKIPVATGSYNAGVSTGVANIGVQTQFTYLDVGVNIDVTPTVHYDREVTLKLKIEVSSQSGTVTISSVSEPIISQRVIEQVIQLKDGEPSILAGILQQQDNNTVSGTPGLGEMPLLKYFFSSRDKVQQQDEIVFLIIPHIVRESILTNENTRAIYTGTSQSIELLHSDKPVQTASGSPNANATSNGQTSAANAASAMLGTMAAQARPVQPPIGASAPAAAAAAMVAPAGGAAPVNVMIVPQTVTQTAGSTFQVAVMLSNAKDLFSVPLQMQFDPKVISLVNVDAGELLSRDGQAVALVHRDEGNGQVTISASRPPNAKGVNGQGTLCTLTFKALAAGDSPLTLMKIGAKDSNQNNLPTVGNQSVVHVK
jgi:general secretion pathway protein D